jgi:prepilin-type N-terminal cleavage/methylation domain-containing protein
MGSRKASGAAGFTLIEVIIASVVMVVGVLAMSGLVALAVQSNGHSRLDTTAVMLTQAVTEQVASGVNFSSTIGGTGVAKLTDCGTHDSTNPWNVDSGPGGSPLASGKIDFSQAKVSGYSMDYVVCNGSTKTTYDVRWNISPLATGATTHTNILTVAARMENGGIGPLTFPINMRVMVGPDPVE